MIPPTHGGPNASAYSSGEKPSSPSIRTAISGAVAMISAVDQDRVEEQRRAASASPRMNRQPVEQSPARSRPRPARGARARLSRRRSRARPSADSAKLAALATTVVTGPSRPIAAPPSGGPSDGRRPGRGLEAGVRAQQLLRRDQRLSRRRRSPPGTRSRTRRRSPTPARAARSVSQSSQTATGTVSSATQRTTSIAIITGRLWRNSTHGPSGIATSAPTASPAAASADTAAGPTSSTRIAISGNASNAKYVPNDRGRIRGPQPAETQSADASSRRSVELAAEVADLVAELGRVLEAQLLGGGEHLLLELAHHLLDLADRHVALLLGAAATAALLRDLGVATSGTRRCPRCP